MPLIAETIEHPDDCAFSHPLRINRFTIHEILASDIPRLPKYPKCVTHFGAFGAFSRGIDLPRPNVAAAHAKDERHPKHGGDQPKRNPHAKKI